MFEAPLPAPIALNFRTNFLIAVATLCCGWLAIYLLGGHDPALHTVLDTSVALTGALIALLLWDISRRTDDSWALFLAISFGLLTIGEMLHVLAVLGWLGGGPGADVELRAGTWGPPAHVLSIGVAAALLFRDRDRPFAWTFGPALGLLAAGLAAFFLTVPRYSPPGLLGITRPTLVLVPLLWAGVGMAYWRRRRDAELAAAIATAAVIFVCSHLIMLYSRAPSDATAMAAHYGKFVGDALLLFSLTQIGAADTARRRLAETQLTALNRELDIRVRERTAQLRESEDRAGLIIDAALDAVVTIDETGAITGWNPQAETIFGWTRDEVVGHPVDQTIMPERFRQAHRDGLARYLATGDAKVLNRRIELVALHKNGGEFPVELAITPIRGAEALTFGAFIRDVSDTKAREAEVKRSSDLLNAIVENMPDMILLKEPSDDGFHYILINAAGERMLGRDRSEILGKSERDLFPDKEAALIIESNRAVVASGRARTFTDRKVTTATGELTVETRVVPISDDGGPTKILAIVRDVSDAKAREEQLRQLQRMDAIGQLTGGVAHDFNNLLAIIHGNSDVLRDRVDGDAESAEMIDDVLGAAERGAELVKRLLAFARMQHLEPEPVDLNARLSNIVGLLERAIGERVNLQVKPAKGLWPAIIDPTQVDDALVNLAINARDAMPDGGSLTIETGKVHFDADGAADYGDVAPGDYVMLAVSDTGTGMSQDTITRAFEPFFTTKEEGKGTGLGLSQVFGWVKQSGGHIKIYSELGHGTTIKLYLPRAEAGLAEPAKTVEVATPRGDEMILVVEDNPSVRKTVIRQLHDLGYQTMEAECGARALELAGQDAAFDLLLTDVIMPGGITGYQLADELREARPALKVLFTSGYTELATAGDHKPRTDGLLSKPYRKQDLGRAIRVALDVAGATVDSSGAAPS